MVTRDGMLVQVIALDGFASETADDEELDYRKQIREMLLRGRGIFASCHLAPWFAALWPSLRKAK
jgi:type IV secretory pathway VirB4 component